MEPILIDRKELFNDPNYQRQINDTIIAIADSFPELLAATTPIRLFGTDFILRISRASTDTLIWREEALWEVQEGND